MTNKEKAEALEKQLYKQRLRMRIIYGILFLVFFVLWITFYFLREASKEVIVHEGLFNWESVTYNNKYIIGIVIGILVSTFSGVMLLSDLILCRYDTAEANGHYITLYRSMIKNVLYVNGEEKDKIVLFSFTYVLETRLPNDVKISVTFTRNAFVLGHISFSDNTPSIEL